MLQHTLISTWLLIRSELALTDNECASDPLASTDQVCTTTPSVFGAQGFVHARKALQLSYIPNPKGVIILKFMYVSVCVCVCVCVCCCCCCYFEIEYFSVLVLVM